MTEIYLQPELEEIVVDSDKKDEWYEKVKELGLEGQLKLTKNSGEKNVGSPYTFMNDQMKLVFETLCPTKAQLDKYDKAMIPIEVLSHIALCKQEGYFHKMEIWYDDKKADPVLVGYLTDTYSSPKHIIARWGDMIVTYELLLDRAMARYTEALKLATEKTEAECKNILTNGENLVKQLFNGNMSYWSIQPSFSLQLTNVDVPF